MIEATVPDRPALVPWCRLVEQDGRVLVEHGGTLVTFEGRATRALLPKLLPLLDGTRAIGEIVQELGAPVAPAVENALSLLAANELLVAGSSPVGDERVAAAASFAAAITRRTTPGEANAILENARIDVLGSGHTAAEIVRTLRETGVGTVVSAGIDTDAGETSLVIAAPDRDEVGGLEVLNVRALESGAGWIQVLPYDGRFLVVGPVFLPGASACRACYVTRRAACSGYEDDFDVLEAEPTRAPAPRALPIIAAGLASLLAIRWLTVEDPTLPGRFYALETGVVLGLSHHNVLRVPRCGACGPSERAVPSPWFEDAA
jgi:bacteriocin biosynthesis cyclodehydratase domain-containing protein